MSYNQFLTFLIYVISGIGISIFFDIFRVLRKTMKTSNIMTYIEDFIFWIIVGLFLIWEIFNINYGEIRAYIFIGLLLGAIIYLFTISKYFIKINVKIITFFKKILKNIIMRVQKLLKLIAKVFNPILKPLSKLTEKIRNLIFLAQCKIKDRMQKKNKNEKKRRI